MCKVSVIVPVYNVEKYLQKALQCLINQTLTDIEVICINDGSTDGCSQILEQFAKNDSRLIVINQENRGQGFSRNRAIELSRGKYIFFVDPDDYIETDALEKLYNLAENENLDVIEFNYIETYENASKPNGKVFNKVFNRGIFNWKQCPNYIFSNQFAVWNKFYRTDLIKNFNIRFSDGRHAEDHLFTIAVRIFAKRVKYIPDCFYYYNIRENSTSHACSEHNFDVVYFIKDIKNILIEQNVYSFVKKAFKRYSSGLLTYHYNMLDENKRTEYLELTKETLSDEEYKVLIRRIKTNHSHFLENIFSIKNKYIAGKKRKVVTILGYPIPLS